MIAAALGFVRALVAALPLRAWAWLGAALGVVAGSVVRVRRSHVERAMREAGIERPAANARAMYRSLGMSAVELVGLGAAGPGRGNVVALWDRVRIEPEAQRRLEEARAHGRGVVLAATHTGNWDLAACAVARAFGRGEAPMPLLVVTKRLRVRALDAFWQRTRRAHGVRLAGAAGAFGRARRVLAGGGAVAMMIDQVPARRRHAVVVDFLGRRAHADKGPAALAARTGAPLVVPAARRLPDGTHVLSVLDVVVPPERAGAAWIEEATARATAALDAFVRRYPSEWLWLHRRWRAPAA